MDFHQRAVLHGPPPKVVWIRLWELHDEEDRDLLRMRAADVKAFGEGKGAALLALR